MVERLEEMQDVESVKFVKYETTGRIRCIISYRRENPSEINITRTGFTVDESVVDSIKECHEDMEERDVL